MQFEPKSMLELFEIMKTPAGKQLIALLQAKGGTELQSAISSAEKGDYSQAQKVISSLLKDTETNDLLKQLGDKYG